MDKEEWMRHTAAHVKLGTTGGSSNVESDDFGAKKVVSSCDIRWDLHIHPSAAVVQVSGAPPVVIGAATSRVLDSH